MTSACQPAHFTMCSHDSPACKKRKKMNSQFHMALITEACVIKKITLDYKQRLREQKQISSEL